MKKIMVHALASGALASAAIVAASPAMADYVGCGAYRPGLLAFMTRTHPAPPCARQGDYIAQGGPTYDGPAIVAPQPTYAPSPSLSGYVRGRYDVPAPVAAPAVRPRHRVVHVKSELPRRKGKPEIVHARAEVRIYGPERMDIRLYRR